MQDRVDQKRVHPCRSSAVALSTWHPTTVGELVAAGKRRELGPAREAAENESMSSISTCITSCSTVSAVVSAVGDPLRARRALSEDLDAWHFVPDGARIQMRGRREP
jgi:hypothetical protein